MFYNNQENTIYEGQFANDKMNGDGLLYTTNGSIIKGWFRNDQLDGQFTLVDENFPAKKFAEKIEEIKEGHPTLFKNV